MTWTPPLGNSFTSSVYRDSFRLLIDTDDATTLAVADLNTTDIAVAAGTAGVIAMGPGDALELVPLAEGTNNETFELWVTRLDPLVDVNTSLNPTLVGWIERMAAILDCTINGSVTAGAVLGALPEINSTDLMADGITVSGEPTEEGASRTDVYVHAGSSVRGYAQVPARGAQFMRVRADRNGGGGVAADRVKVLARRIRGEAMPGKGGMA